MPLTLPMDIQSFLPQARYSIVHTVYSPGVIQLPQTVDEIAVYLVTGQEIMRSNGAYMMNDQGFSGRSSDFVTPPKPRDMIRWQDVNYRVIDMDNHLLYDHFDGVMRDLRLAYSLTTLVNVYRQAFHMAPGGRPLGVPVLFADNLLARVQPMDQGETQEFGVTKLERRYNVILETEFDMQQSDQIWLTDGRVLEVDRCLDKECLDLLSRVEAVDRGATWQA